MTYCSGTEDDLGFEFALEPAQLPRALAVLTAISPPDKMPVASSPDERSAALDSRPVVHFLECNGAGDGLANKAVTVVIERTLQADVLMVESEQEVFTAMIALKEGRDSFADALIGALGDKAGCSRTLTFDRQAPRLASFERL